MTEENVVNEVDMGMVRFTEWLVLAWAFVWRGILVSIGSMLTGGIIGGIIGFILGFIGSMLGLDVETLRPFITILGGIIGFFIGLCFVVLLLKWIFKARFKRFRLTLVEIN